MSNQYDESLKANYYRPKIFASVDIPIFAEDHLASVASHGADSRTINLPITDCKLERNNFHTADKAEVKCLIKDIGIDLRAVHSGVLRVWFQDVLPTGQLDMGQRPDFIGVVSDVTTSRGDDATCTIVALDYSSLFIAHKTPLGKHLPSYGLTLREGWRRLCAGVGYVQPDGEVISSVEALSDRIRFGPEVNQDIQIGKYVDEFTRKHGLVTERSDAWATWSQIVSDCGLVCWIDGDEMVIKTSAEQWDSKSSPRLIYGENISHVEMHVDNSRQNKGVLVSSYNARTGRVLEAYYPPLKAAKTKAVKRTTAATKTKPARVVKALEYERFDLSGIHFTDGLQIAAERVYFERARQELRGILETSEMQISGVSVLDLRAGDNIRVEVDGNVNETVNAMGPEGARRYLVRERGYSPAVADLIIQSAKGLAKLGSNYHVTEVEISLSPSEYSCRIGFCNLIEISKLGA